MVACKGCQQQQERHRDELYRSQYERDCRVNRGLSSQTKPWRGDQGHDMAGDTQDKGTETDEQ